MPTDAQTGSWLDTTQQVTLVELIGLSGFTESEVIELVHADALVPTDPQASSWMFSADCVVTVRKANRLREDLELDMHALALALALLEQIRALEVEVVRLRAQRPSFRSKARP